VTSDVKEDTLVILEFLDNFNGEYYIPERFWTSNNVLELFTDAAGNPALGCAAYPNIDSSTMTLIFLTDNNFSKCDFSF
jgi:hypothetical protein